MAFEPLSVKIDATVVVSLPNGAKSTPVYQGPDFVGFSDNQASKVQSQQNVDIPATQSQNVPLPAGATASKFLFYRFDNAVTLSGLVSAANTRFGIVEIEAAVPLSIQAGANDTKGFVMILGA